MRRHHSFHATESNQHRTTTAVITATVLAWMLVILPCSASAQDDLGATWQRGASVQCEQDARDLRIWLDALAHRPDQGRNDQDHRAASGGMHSALAAHLAGDCPEVGQVLDVVEDLPADGQARALAEWMPRAVVACGCAVDLDALRVVSYAAATGPAPARDRAVASRSARVEADTEPTTPTSPRAVGLR